MQFDIIFWLDNSLRNFLSNHIIKQFDGFFSTILFKKKNKKTKGNFLSNHISMQFDEFLMFYALKMNFPGIVEFFSVYLL